MIQTLLVWLISICFSSEGQSAFYTAYKPQYIVSSSDLILVRRERLFLSSRVGSRDETILCTHGHDDQMH